MGFAQKIFQADSPEQASIKVFAVEEPQQADLWVCFVWEESEITRTGLWMDMRFSHEADVIIYFVDEEKDANLKIWLVDTPEESKWINESKKNLLTLKQTGK
jgi:hypothetical protein